MGASVLGLVVAATMSLPRNLRRVDYPNMCWYDVLTLLALVLFIYLIVKGVLHGERD